MLMFLRASLDQHLEQRASLVSAVDAAISPARAGNRDLTDAEARSFNEAKSKLAAHDVKIAEIRANIAEAEADEQRQSRTAAVTAEFGTAERSASGWMVDGSPTTYRRNDVTAPSWTRDMIRFSLHGDSDARDRLTRNNREVGTEHRALSGTDGAGGEFVPPLWLVNEYLAVARAGRVTANLCRINPLPGGTDSIKLPKVSTGTSVAEQTTQNVAVSNTDAVTTSVTADVATLAGQQVVSVQFIEQSPVNTDEVILLDLLAELAKQVDVFVINNNAANKRGLLNVTGVNAVTYTDATPTVGELYPKVADGVQQIDTGRFLPAEAIVMHPRRWAWFLAATDTATRPLVLPESNKPQNAVAFSTGTAAVNGLVGSMHGLPVYVDPNIPINLGAGTNEDRIIIARMSDIHLYEGVPRAEAFREPKADQLSVLFRVYNYLALHSERYPKSISVISGTGLITPTF